MNQTFINAAFTKAINDYQNSKNEPEGIAYNSFLTVVIRLLVCIYSELDILNPLMTDNEGALKENLCKFGYSSVDLETFFNNLTEFEKIDSENEKLTIKKDNPYFVTIQKQIVDMLILKKLNFHLTEKEVVDFYNLLYTPNTNNALRLSFNFLTAKDVNEVEGYFKKQMKENVKIVEAKEKNILNIRAYEILGFTAESIYTMDSEQIDKLNHQVYDYFKIRENAINKEYLLEKAIEDYDREQNKVTSGNGYVDILLVMGVICTVIMVVSIITFLVI